MRTPRQRRELLETTFLDARGRFRQATANASTTFEFARQSLRLDPHRWVVASIGSEEYELDNGLLEVYGGGSRSIRMSRLVEALAAALGGKENDGVALAHLANLIVVQPLVNPAFDALFWLVLSVEDVNCMRHDVDVYDIYMPMIYEMTQYPRLVPSPEVVRAGQIDWLEEAKLPVDRAVARAADEASWTASCNALLESRLDRIDADLMVMFRP